MVLIITTSDDVSAMHVRDWLLYYGCQVLMVDEKSLLTISRIDISNESLELIIDDQEFKNSE